MELRLRVLLWAAGEEIAAAAGGAGLAAGVEPDVTNRPAVHVEPGMSWGGPQLRGIATDAIAGLYLAEKDEAAVCDDYDLTRHELLVALWFEGTHGRKAHRKALGAWAQSAYWALARGEIDGIEAPDVA